MFLRRQTTLIEKITEAVMLYVEKNAENIFKRAGVKRAQSYQAAIMEYMDDEKLLCTKLYVDCVDKKGNGPLGTSNDLREALITVLLRHLGVTKQERDIIEKRAVRSVVVSANTASAALVPYAVREAIIGTIAKKMAERDIPREMPAADEVELAIKKRS